MRQILVISSHVAYGTVGAAATVAALHQAGIETSVLPTVVFSNHPGHARFAGTAVEPALLEEMSAALESNGWLAKFDAVFSGYLPSAGHVAWIGRLVSRMRALNPNVVYICDPILGDDPAGLYIDAATAEAVRDILAPLADVLTPNRFELAWLSGRDVQSVDDAARAASALGRPIVIATSIPDVPNTAVKTLANVLVAKDDVFVAHVEEMDDVPHGTGDLFAGLFMSRLMQGASAEAALSHAVAGVAHALDVSRGSDHLIVSSIDWTNGVKPVLPTRYASISPGG